MNNQRNKKNAKATLSIMVMAIILTISASNHSLAESYVIGPNSKPEIKISTRGVNRIGVESDRIAQVIGNEEEYIIDSDGDLGQVFITPNLKSADNNTISVNIITEQGKQIDVKFIAQDIEPQTVIFKMSSGKGRGQSLGANNSFNNYASMNNPANNSLSTSSDFKQEIIELIQSARNDKLDQTLIKEPLCFKNQQRVKFLRGTEASNDKYTVLQALITNNTKERIRIEEKEFAHCKSNIIAVALDNVILDVSATTKLYLVAKND